MVSERVFLGRLPFEIKTRDVEDFLEDHGFKNYRNVILKNGYGFVDFENSKEADEAVRELDRKDLLGQRIVCEAAKGERRRENGYDRRSRDRDRDRPRSRSYSRDRNSSRYGAPYNTEWRIVIKNLSSRVGWQELKDLFRQHGNVTYAECNKRTRGEGLVEYATEREMQKAMSRMQNIQFYGRSLKLVDDAPCNKRRRRSDSSPRRNSRRRSRSRSSPRSASPPSSTKARSHSRSPRRSPPRFSPSPRDRDGSD